MRTLTRKSGRRHQWVGTLRTAPQETEPSGIFVVKADGMDPTRAFYVCTIPAQGGDPARVDLSKSAWPTDIMWRRAQ